MFRQKNFVLRQYKFRHGFCLLKSSLLMKNVCLVQCICKMDRHNFAMLWALRHFEASGGGSPYHAQ